MIKLQCCGAAGEVTGSRHLFNIDNTRLLLDCGLFQGHRKEALEKNRKFPFDPTTLDGVLLSHAHIDHSGTLPLLVKSGYQGPIYSTPATLELCAVMLPDSGRLQENDAAFFNKLHSSDGQQIEPLYTEEDAITTLRRFKIVDYDTPFQLSPSVTATFLNAGHVLGSAMIQLDSQQPQGRRRLLYTGDLGRRHTLLMQGPTIPPAVNDLLIESTYGNRLHSPVGNAEDSFKRVLERAQRIKGKVLIPSFALERTQEIIFILEKLRRHKQIPDVPLYVDSPMAVNITEIFNRNLKGFYLDPAFKDYIKSDGDPFGFENVNYVRTKDESQRLNAMPGPMIIISASGMCEGGRILHHLRNTIDKESTTILLVGYQAEGTLGRKLSEGAKRVKIFGFDHDVMAKVETMSFFSAHADRDDLHAFVDALGPQLKNVVVVHGDTAGREALKEYAKARGVPNVYTPAYQDTIDLH